MHKKPINTHCENNRKDLFSQLYIKEEQLVEILLPWHGVRINKKKHELEEEIIQ